MSANIDDGAASPGANTRTVKAVLIVCWAFLVVAGFAALWNYSLTPGKIDEPPVQWPADSKIPLESKRKTLLVFVHPQCPCTRATIGELARIMSQCRQGVCVYVLAARPAGTAEDWEDTALCNEAKAIPGVKVLTDWDDVEAKQFQATTSGLCILYDAQGHMLFRGGITTSRGHEGDNDGAGAVVAWVTTGESTVVRTPVFGCPIFNEHEGGKQ